MKNYLFGEIKYIVIKDYKNGFSKEEVEKRYTEYFEPFDYIVGDWSYGKLRLKGFYDPNSTECKEYNTIENLENYLKEFCSYECRYFVLKRQEI